MQKKLCILLVDDQREILNALERLFKLDYDVLTASSGKEALEILQGKEVALILSDQRMPQMDGVTFLKKTIATHPETVRLLITGYADIEATIEAVNEAKIYQYISKPFEPEDLQKIVSNAVERYRLVKHNQQLQDELTEANQKLFTEKEALQTQVEQQLDLGNMIGNSPKMLQVFKLVKKVMNTPTTVLLLGETGTGKELLAKILHFNSSRKENIFVAQNCGAIPDTLLQSELFGHMKGAFTGASSDKKGIFETAHSGTIFLDEIGDTSPALQLGLLRVLQEGEIKPIGSATTKHVDVRVIAATNKDLQAEVKASRFREDLYYRLSVFPIMLPPLRERRQDIPDLVDFFIQKYSKRINKKVEGIHKSALSYLMQAEFPGNIRELENEVERMVTLADENKELDEQFLSARFLEQTPLIPMQSDQKLNLKQAQAALEKRMITQVLREMSGNVLRSAEKLGISRVGLHKMLKRYEIVAAQYKQRTY